MKTSRVGLWILFLLIAIVSVGMVLLPVFLIRPFAPQTPESLSQAFFLRRWAPPATVAVAILAVLLAWRLGKTSHRRTVRALTVLIALSVVGAAWFARQNHFEWMFVPLTGPRFVGAGQADFVEADAMVLSVTLAGDAAAYPVPQLAYHHLVQDRVAGIPIVATY